jgi:hypothetical protein
VETCLASHSEPKFCFAFGSQSCPSVVIILDLIRRQADHVIVVKRTAQTPTLEVFMIPPVRYAAMIAGIAGRISA